MAFELPPLDFDYSSLEPYIDTTTMNIHHTKHHQAYINNLNAAISKFPEVSKLSLVEICSSLTTPTIPSSIEVAVRNNSGGHWNHSLFWTVMTNPSSTSGPQGGIKEVIESTFGSVDEMKNGFNAAAASRFGSGWAWLVAQQDGSLAISSTPNQDNPLMPLTELQGYPVLALDVWEHAYYLKYQNRRPEYIAAFWNVVNWEKVSEYYEMAKEGKWAIGA